MRHSCHTPDGRESLCGTTSRRFSPSENDTALCTEPPLSSGFSQPRSIATNLSPRGGSIFQWDISSSSLGASPRVCESIGFAKYEFSSSDDDAQVIGCLCAIKRGPRPGRRLWQDVLLISASSSRLHSLWQCFYLYQSQPFAPHDPATFSFSLRKSAPVRPIGPSVLVSSDYVARNHETHRGQHPFSLQS